MSKNRADHHNGTQFAQTVYLGIHNNHAARFTAVVSAALFLLSTIVVGLMSGLFGFIAVLGAGAVLLLFFLYPAIPLYMMAATFFFIDLQIVIGPFTAPVVDWIALAAVCAWLGRLIWWKAIGDIERSHISFPLLLPFIAWVSVGILSSLFSWDIFTSLYYTARPLAFFYIAYVIVVINTASLLMLKRMTQIILAMATFLATYGVIGFFVQDAERLLDRRVSPFPIQGLELVVANHNIIAGTVLIALPLCWYYLVHQRTQKEQKQYAVLFAFLVTALLLTFSRSGWIGLFLEVLVLIAMYYKEYWRTIAKWGIGVGLVALPLAVYMVIFSLQSEVQGSTSSRLEMDRIALELFTESPLVGAGPRSFVPAVESNRWYMFEFGSAQDAHGLIQKTASEMGILGLITFCTLLIGVLVVLWRAYRAVPSSSSERLWYAALCTMAVGIMSFQLFQPTYYSAHFWIPLGIALAYALRYTHGRLLK